MSWPELHRTLTDLIGGLEPPSDSTLVVDRAEIDIPLEIRTAVGANGLIVYARAPHSRWVAGILPQVHSGRLVIETSDAEPSRGDAA